MPNKFSGKLTDKKGNGLEGVNVTITGKGIPSGTKTTTNRNGDWTISINNSIDNKDVTVIFSKKGLETRKITNPKETEVINTYIDPLLGGTLDLQEFYPSGKWKITSLSQENQDIVNQELEDLYTFIKDNPASTEINVTASESRVPNSDREEGSNRNFSEPGSLAQARATELIKYVTDFLNKRRKEDQNPLPIEAMPKINPVNINQVGGPDWNPDDPTLEQEKQNEGVSNAALLNRFKTHQFARLEIKLTTNPKCSWVTINDDNNKSGAFVSKNSNTYSTIDFDPAVVPDIFIVKALDANGNKILKQTDVFYQRDNKDAYGDLITWGLLAFYSQDKKAPANPFAWKDNEDLNINLLQKGTISLEEGFDRILNVMREEFTTVKFLDKKTGDLKLRSSSGTIYYNFNLMLIDAFSKVKTITDPLKQELNNAINAAYAKKDADRNAEEKKLAALKNSNGSILLTTAYYDTLKARVNSKYGIPDPSKITNEKKQQLKNDMKEHIFKNDTLTYYVVKQVDYYSFKFKDNNIPEYTDFQFKGIQGVYFGGSSYRYRLCY